LKLINTNIKDQKNSFSGLNLYLIELEEKLSLKIQNAIFDFQGWCQGSANGLFRFRAIYGSISKKYFSTKNNFIPKTIGLMKNLFSFSPPPLFTLIIGTTAAPPQEGMNSPK
jgi:hypothetical protein